MPTPDLEERFQRWLKLITEMHGDALFTANESVAWAPLRKPLAESTLASVTTAGAHLKSQPQHDLLNPRGDVSFCEIPGETPAADLAVDHVHYSKAGGKAPVTYPGDEPPFLCTGWNGEGAPPGLTRTLGSQVERLLGVEYLFEFWGAGHQTACETSRNRRPLIRPPRHATSATSTPRISPPIWIHRSFIARRPNRGTPPAREGRGPGLRPRIRASDESVQVRGTICLAASRIPGDRVRLPKSPSRVTQEPACPEMRRETWKQSKERARASRAERSQDTADATADPNCVFPIDWLRELAAEGIIGAVAPSNLA